jgi:hypothetical protein
MGVESTKLVVEPGAGRTGKLAMVAYQFQHYSPNMAVILPVLLSILAEKTSTIYTSFFWNMQLNQCPAEPGSAFYLCSPDEGNLVT